MLDIIYDRLRDHKKALEINKRILGFYQVVPKGIRTPVAAVKGQCPRPLDDGDLTVSKYYT